MIQESPPQGIGFAAAEFALNPEPRCPCVLLLDTSSSMHGAPIRQLNLGIQTFREELIADAMAIKRVEVAIISFGPVEVVSDFATADNFFPPPLVSSGQTPMGAAIERALGLLETRKVAYKSNGISYYRPWIFLVTDGSPTDAWWRAAEHVKTGEQAKKFMFFSVGVEGADFSILRKISVRDPLKLKELRFSDLFKWLSGSLGAISRSNPGEAVIMSNILEVVLRRTTDFPEALQAKYYRAVHEFNSFQKEWIFFTGDSVFLKKRSELARLKSEYEGLPEHEKRKILQLKNERKENQRTQFLSQFRIENVKIAGMGNGHKATLQSYGIETAADIDGLQVLEIPGIGSMLATQLLEWRDEIAARFIFDPDKEIDPIIIAKLKNRIIIRRRQIETALTHGETALHHLVEKTKTNAIAKMPQAKKLAKNLAQAKVDWEFVR